MCRKIERPLESRPLPNDPYPFPSASALTGREEARHVYYPAPVSSYQQQAAPPRRRQRIRNQTSARRPYNYPPNPQNGG